MRRARRSALAAVLAVTSALAAWVPSTAEATSASTISGSVTSAGSALANACVTAILTRTGYPQASTTSGHNGSYSLSVSPDSYWVRFDDCGGAAGDYVGALYPTVIVVAAGQSVTGIDADLAAAGSISGQVTDASTAAPLANVCVRAWPAGTGKDGTVRPVGTTATAADGTYALRWLLPGSYEVRFDAQEACGQPVWQAYSPLWYPAAVGEAGAATVQVAAESDTPGIAAAMHGASLAGAVGDGSKPVPGVCVRAYAHGTTPATASPVGEAVTDFQGAYAMSTLPDGSYDVLFIADGDCLGGIHIESVPQWYQSALTQDGANPIAVTSGSFRYSVSGDLVYGGVLSGKVVDAGSGMPMSGACVFLYSVDGTNPDTRAWTDALGKYSLALPAGDYEVEFIDCSNWPERLPQWWQGAHDEVNATPVTVPLGGSIANVDAAMSYPRAPGAPSRLSALGGLRQVALSWSAPANPGTSPVDFYNVYRSDSTGWDLLSSQVETSYVDSGLSDQKLYSYKVTAESADGEGSPAAGQARTWELPSPPALGAPITAPGQVSLSWPQPVTVVGGAPVTGYTVYRSTVSTDKGTAVASAITANSYTDASVAPDVMYYYRVAATNPVGEGGASNPQQAVWHPGLPTVSITSRPAQYLASHSATWGFTSTNPAGGPLVFDCALDNAPWSRCTSPVTYTGVPDGFHDFTVRVTDVTGKDVILGRSWTVDTVAPTVAETLAQPFQPRTWIYARGLSQGSNSDVASVDTRYRVASWNAGFGPYIYPSGWQSSVKINRTPVNQWWDASLTGSLGRTYCFSTRARDLAGNLSTWSPERCTTVALDDRALKRSAGWTTGKGRGYVGETWTETTKQGASLTLSGTQVRRVAVFFRRCAGCGSVAVYVGGHYWKTVDTATKLTPGPWWSILPAHALSTATVVLKVLSSGKPVYIDGLGISRA